MNSIHFAKRSLLSQSGRALVVTVLAGVSMAWLLGCSSASEKWEKNVSKIVWVAYSPPSADPGQGIEATPQAIERDIEVLKTASFNGLVTYSASGVLGRELPAIAQKQGFKGLIMGVWDPKNEEEIAAVKEAAPHPIVLGYCVGNEGLGKRYQLEELSAAIEQLREATGKPVTTTEENRNES